MCIGGQKSLKSAVELTLTASLLNQGSIDVQTAPKITLGYNSEKKCQLADCLNHIPLYVWPTDRQNEQPTATRSADGLIIV